MYKCLGYKRNPRGCSLEQRLARTKKVLLLQSTYVQFISLKFSVRHKQENTFLGYQWPVGVVVGLRGYGLRPRATTLRARSPRFRTQFRAARRGSRMSIRSRPNKVTSTRRENFVFRKLLVSVVLFVLCAVW